MINRVAKFEKVSFEQFSQDISNIVPCYMYSKYDPKFKTMTDENFYRYLYDNIELPEGSTSGSAGYDFHIPFRTMFEPHSTLIIPTGIRCKIEDGWVLSMFPRSGHGFKYGIHLANTVGIIDSDYYNSSNEGHIMIKLTRDNDFSNSIVEMKKGDKFCQGIFLPYGVTVDDEVSAKRDGGFGSTGA